MAETYISVIQALLEFSVSDNATDTTCDETIVDEALFYQLSIIPAVFILISFAFSQPRRRLLLHVLRARPGLIYPMDITCRQHRVSYACAFGTTVYLVMQCIFAHFQVINYHGPLVFKSFILLVSVLIFGLVHFPVFASLTVGGAYGYGLGALYTWMLTVISFLRLFNCHLSGTAQALEVLRNAPYLVCLLYLCASIPVRFYKAIKEKQFFVRTKDGTLDVKSMAEIKTSHEGIHVQNLLVKPPPHFDEDLPVATVIFNFIKSHTYESKPGFQYSARLLSTLLVAFIILYSVSFEFFTVITIFYIRINHVIRHVLGLDPTSLKTVVTVMHYLTGIAFGSASCATLLGVHGIIRLFTGYRNTMYRLYQGNLTHTLRETTYPGFLVGAMKYSGYQVIYICWGFVIHVCIFMVVCSIIAFVFGSISNGYYQWLTDGVLHLGPVYVTTIMLHFAQLLVARHSFLMQPERSMDLNNRRMFFIFTFFTFFYNIFLGIFSCLLRIIKGVVIGAILVPRLDQSNLPVLYDHMDPGYMAFVGFVKLECAQTHPVLLVFLRLLMLSARQRRKEGSKGQLQTSEDEEKRWSQTRKLSLRRREEQYRRSFKHGAAIFNWFVLYTLINNPDLRMLRKGYIQKVKLAKEMDIAIPKSDTFVDIDEIIRKAMETHTDPTLIGKFARLAGGHFDMLVQNVQRRFAMDRDSEDSCSDNSKAGSRLHYEKKERRAHRDDNDDDDMHYAEEGRRLRGDKYDDMHYAEDARRSRGDKYDDMHYAEEGRRPHGDKHNDMHDAKRGGRTHRDDSNDMHDPENKRQSKKDGNNGVYYVKRGRRSHRNANDGMHYAQRGKRSYVGDTDDVDDTNRGRRSYIGDHDDVDDTYRGRRSYIGDHGDVDDTNRGRTTYVGDHGDVDDTNRGRTTYVGDHDVDDTNRGRRSYIGDHDDVDDTYRGRRSYIGDHGDVDDTNRGRTTYVGDHGDVDDTNRGRTTYVGDHGDVDDTNRGRTTYVGDHDVDDTNRGRRSYIGDHDDVHDTYRGRRSYIGDHDDVDDTNRGRRSYIGDHGDVDDTNRGRTTYVGDHDDVDDTNRGRTTYVGDHGDVDDTNRGRTTYFGDHDDVHDTNRGRRSSVGENVDVDDTNRGRRWHVGDNNDVDDRNTGRISYVGDNENRDREEKHKFKKGRRHKVDRNIDIIDRDRYDYTLPMAPVERTDTTRV